MGFVAQSESPRRKVVDKGGRRDPTKKKVGRGPGWKNFCGLRVLRGGRAGGGGCCGPGVQWWGIGCLSLIEDKTCADSGFLDCMLELEFVSAHQYLGALPAGSRAVADPHCRCAAAQPSPGGC